MDGMACTIVRSWHDNENDRILFRFFEWKLMTCLKLLSAINSKKRVLNLDKYKCKDQDRCLPISIWEVE